MTVKLAMNVCECVDGRFYINPLIWDDDIYFRIINDEAQLVVRRYANTTEISSRRRANAALKHFEICGKVMCLEESDVLMPFPPFWEGVDKSDIWNIDLRGPIPYPKKHEGAVNEVIMDQMKHVWTARFLKEDITAIKEGRELTPRLTMFLLGRTILKGEQDKYRAKLARLMSLEESGDYFVVRRK